MVKTCIIIPCYNEAKRLHTQRFIDFQNKDTPFDLYFVNDGSTDSTKKTLETIVEATHNCYTIHLNKNKGKAEAIRHAILNIKSSYSYVGYLDADLSTSLEELERLHLIIQEQGKKMVLGSRLKILGASIKRRLHRHIFGRMVATFIDSIILKLDIYDTQCGAKIIEHDLALELFNKPFKSKWLFDVELLARAKNTYGESFCKNEILEVPLRKWHDEGESKVTFSDMLKTPFHLMKIYFHYK